MMRRSWWWNRRNEKLKRPDCGLRKRPRSLPRKPAWRRRSTRGSWHGRPRKRGCRLRRRPRGKKGSDVHGKRRIVSRWSETSARRGALLGSGPSQDKGKGRAPVPEKVRGEVPGVVCDLCDKKEIPCRWGMVSAF